MLNTFKLYITCYQLGERYTAENGFKDFNGFNGFRTLIKKHQTFFKSYKDHKQKVIFPLFIYLQTFGQIISVIRALPK